MPWVLLLPRTTAHPELSTSNLDPVVLGRHLETRISPRIDGRRGRQHRRPRSSIDNGDRRLRPSAQALGREIVDDVYDRKLLGELAARAWRALKLYFDVSFAGAEVTPGAVGFLQTAGELLNLN